MRRINLYKQWLLLGGMIVFSSCSKWLDVSPKTELKEEDQFSSQQGYIDALFGIYQNAASDSGYGQNLSYGLLDVLAQRYENKTSTSNSWYAQAARYNYTSTGGAILMNVQNTIDQIWGNMYKTISNANYILENTDSSKSVLAGTAFNIIKGESLAMRGFAHFDLARMYAPAYMDGAQAETLAIPYYDRFTVTPQPRLTLGEVLDKCEADLKQAETLLSVYQDIDQIAGNQTNTSPDLFLLYRQNHMNYWAVKATLARLYQYKGNKALAYKYAMDVINSNKFRFITQQELNSDPTAVNSDLTFSYEHIFSIYVSDLKIDADNVFKNSVVTGSDPADLFSVRATLDNMYEASVVGYGTDLRNVAAPKSLWNQVSTALVYTKKYYADNPINVRQRLIPVIRLPEMYYIVAESSPTVAEGVTWLNKVRVARGIPELTEPASTVALDAEILKEYRKEFYGEGQLWFYYKRKNTVTIPDGVGNPMSLTKYVFPLPLSEIQYGK